MDAPVEIPTLSEAQIRALLDEYAQVNGEIERLAQEEQTSIDESLPESSRHAIAAIKARYSARCTPLAAQLDALGSQIRVAVIEHGTTVKTKHYQAIWSKPRVTWDDAAPQGYAAIHEEILQFRIERLPTCSIRKR